MMPCYTFTMPRPAPSVRTPRLEDIENRLLHIGVIGRTLAPRGRHACIVCRRAVPLVCTLVEPGSVTCGLDACALTTPGHVARALPTPYGTAVRRGTFLLFAHVVDLPSGRSCIRAADVRGAAKGLANGYLSLLRWQEAFDLVERVDDPVGWQQGRTLMVPPRWIDQVVSIRAGATPVPLDPLDHVPSNLAIRVRAVLGLPEEEGRVRLMDLDTEGQAAQKNGGKKRATRSSPRDKD